MSGVHIVRPAGGRGPGAPVEHALGSAKEAAEIVGYYLQRWRIPRPEIRRRVEQPRTGCNRHQWVIAFMLMTLLGRQVHCDPDLMFTGNR